MANLSNTLNVAMARAMAHIPSLQPRHREGSRDQEFRCGLRAQVLRHSKGGGLEEENVQVQPKDIQIPQLEMGHERNLSMIPWLM